MAYDKEYAKESANKYNEEMEKINTIVEDVESAISNLENSQLDLSKAFECEQILDEWKGVKEFEDIIGKRNIEADRDLLKKAQKYENGSFWD